VKTLLQHLRRDQSGSSAIEFAIAVPVLVAFIYGIFSVSLLFQANAGVQHALGEAARYATIFPTPTDTQIQTMISESDFGLGGGTLDTPVIDNSQLANGFKTISLTYHRPVHLLFMNGPTVTITRSKRVYVAG
jgi:Flp pilus assembly protein TadG